MRAWLPAWSFFVVIKSHLGAYAQLVKCFFNIVLFFGRENHGSFSLFEVDVSSQQGSPYVHELLILFHRELFLESGKSACKGNRLAVSVIRARCFFCASGGVNESHEVFFIHQQAVGQLMEACVCLFAVVVYADSVIVW